MNPCSTLRVLRSRVLLFWPFCGAPLTGLFHLALIAAVALLCGCPLLGQAADLASPPPPPPLPDLGSSVIRLAGALLFVVALFLCGAWGLRRWQQAQLTRAPGPRLAVIDVQSLGPRQTLYVIGYERQRFLIGSSASGLSLITHLPEGDSEAAAPPPSVSFATAFQQVIHRKAS